MAATTEQKPAAERKDAIYVWTDENPPAKVIAASRGKTLVGGTEMPGACHAVDAETAGSSLEGAPLRTGRFIINRFDPHYDEMVLGMDATCKQGKYPLQRINLDDPRATTLPDSVKRRMRLTEILRDEATKNIGRSSVEVMMDTATKTEENERLRAENEALKKQVEALAK